ncbi:WXG100 family type VII secretion target [Streptomyces durbertensis]|uniref:ESAT-6-like protein n=1 Tax=Streptomyces durbertensis TaxID=2448886 RepID=A0ABR6EHH0_9ACTN|nr:WXG100 family type VII secretion target [Streptomyces durbertensis]MBB1244777.1 WXG100 family type VII secretion target [Streptomyces durbertensis]
MSGQILVNFQTIQQAATDVRTTAGNIKSQLDDLESGVKRIAQSWEGSAKEGYQTRQQEWDKRAASLHATLLAISKALDTAAQNYEATEQKNAGIWN